MARPIVLRGDSGSAFIEGLGGLRPAEDVPGGIHSSDELPGG
ncbi:hypothetical protein LAV_00016 [Sphingobium phage Lacusarx]|uniref:Uncharacterized protein n=1 Tax=Sphingobium phage Lacusarx TaxID=1980139 RepID=A0A1W6DX23_9CAUD|nr:hypothetical protein FDH44_gp016 [Sphingobium phage Lacusarx]ARK07416.1 hypothetical protein LAV_00016 [Sphingobium phage Lacusarx]